jgi:PAS domain S-box-containing protein
LPRKKPRPARVGPSPAGQAAPSEIANTVVAGIGASAGGLDALEKLFSLIPADSGLAFVVVQHLERRHPSLLAELLGRQTRIPVAQAVDGMRPEPDHVYIIAPNTILTLDRGALRVAPASEPTSALRIDALFRSLAKDRGEYAVGVLLSGAGSDGTAGLRVIKEHGGLGIAQDPRTAKHGSMPRTAIEAGLVDEVLAIEKIPAALVAHARHLARTRRMSGDTLDQDIAGSLGAICALLHQRTGHDFSRYKEATLLRRIRRRVHVRRAASAAEYVTLLELDPGEPQLLLKDLLIGVTQFFRDPDTFERIGTEILPRILEGKPAEAPLRIWVPGCASGEEAFSLAILAHEHLARHESRRFVQVFATDIDAEMITEARAGRYPAEIEERVSRQRLERWFVRDGAGWRMGKEIRDSCIFSVHSLIRDAPFSALDLISCRNVLIYLEPDLQRKVIPVFHYALRHGGYLLLGPAEGLVSHPDLFETVDKKHRIFRRKETVARPQVEFPLSARGAPPSAEAAPAPSPRQRATAAIERMLLDEYAPPCAVVDERGDIQFVAGRLGRFLAPPAGAPTTNLLDAFRDSLRLELRSALHAAAASGGRVIRDQIPVELDDAVRRVRLTVRPVPGADGLFAVVVQERAAEQADGPEAIAATLVPPPLEQMESELRTTRADLKAAVESAEAANEELRSANEELISTNEELQSANEELQTSKEELQSLNEELETVNTELQRNVEELGTTNSDLQNLFASTEIATIFLDRDLRITRFTPAATELFRFVGADVGRSIADFAPRFEGQDLVADAREVSRTLIPIERQARAALEGSWFILRVLPYVTVDNRMAGVVITFVDISQLKRAEDALRQSEERFRLLVDSVNDYAIFMLAPDGIVVSWNAGAQRLKGYRAEEIVGRHFSRFYPDEEVRAGKPQRMLETAAAQGRAEEEGWRVRKDGSTFWASVLLTAIRDEGGGLRGFAEVSRDFTARNAMEARLAHLASFPERNPSPIVEADVEGRVNYANPAALGLFPDIREKGSAHPWLSGWQTVAPSVREGSAPTRFRVVTVGDRSFHQVLVHTPEEHVVRTYGTDITERVRAEEALRESEQRFAVIHDRAPFGIALNRASDGALVSVNEAFTRMFEFTREELVGRTSPELGIADADSQRRVAAELRERGAVRDLELERRTKSGARRLYSLGVDRVAIGGEAHTLTTIQDVTERRKAEEALQRSLEGLRRLSDASLEVVRETDLAGMLQAISEAALVLTSARSATCGHGNVAGQLMVGGSARAPGTPACPPGNMFVLQKGGVHMDLALGAEAIRLTDADMRAHPRWWGLPQGHVPMRGLLGARMLGRNGQPSGMILVSDKDQGDFTEEDESLLKHLATIASLALQHVEARIALEESDRSKNEFLAMLSHELRNPLAPIRNSLHVLERAAPGGDQARRAQTVIDRQVVHLTRLVDDLLDVTRISRGKIQLRRERLDLCDVIRRALEDQRWLFVQNEVETRVELPEAPLWIEGDRTRVSQVIGNLLHNSAKFTEPRGEVDISAEANASLRQAVVRIRDSGVGIAPEMLPRVFEPFSQADTSLDRSKGGLGLGLALVKGLVEMHGGTVTVGSEGLGKGAEFVVRLPLASAVAPAAEPPPVAPDARPRRVLVIEDNVDAAESLKDVLEFHEHTVELAFTGPEGIEKARAFQPDVVLCDIGLPGMDGYEVARAMRADPALRGARLVALTGYAAPDDVAKSRDAGFDVHLAKPPTLEKLEEALAGRAPAAGSPPRSR